MVENNLNPEDELFIHLVNTFAQSAWISMGKIKNPMTDALERNISQASYYIDLLDMLQKKMKGNLSDWEEQFIIHNVSELKLNFIDEKKKGDTQVKADKEDAEKPTPKNKKKSKNTPKQKKKGKKA